MRKPLFTHPVIVAAFLFFIACTEDPGQIKINQIGYYPNAPKIAVIPGQLSGSFQIVEAGSGEVVYGGDLSDPQEWPYSGEWVTQADFSELTEAGRYRLEQGDAAISYEFEIRDEIFRELSAALIKAFYYNRASTELSEEYAGKWARPAGHPDDQVQIHESAATAVRPAGTALASPKGWYDAGDYNKYAVNSGIATYTILAAYEHFPSFYQDLSLNIPESGNGVPDILNEARWNLDWLMTAQDPEDGGVYHKVTSLDFSGVVMPHEDQANRYAVMKSTAGSLNFAAVMAVASRIFREFDPEFSEAAIRAAEAAWEWAVENPEQIYIQPPDVHTGAYGDRTVTDEFTWAAAELYITTGDDAYWQAGNFRQATIGVPSWVSVGPLAWISLAHHREDLTEAADVSMIEERIRQQGNTLLYEYGQSAYGVSMGRYGNQDFVWGSNGVISNHSMMLIQAYRLDREERYLEATLSNLDYILGRNAVGISFVTGFGSRSPMFPHHRQSAADGVTDPVPGFVVGGPQPGQQDSCEYPSDLPALSYLDDWCSYSTNEVTINWNAPLIYTAGAIEYYYGGNARSR
ncbi:MAG: glycoside hydrolase family 9 protein [Balneolaceae bacterium]